QDFVAGLENAGDAEPGQDLFTPLLRLSNHGSAMPLFCLHPAGGLGWCYMGLGRHMPDRSLYALQARGLRTGETMAQSMAEMAQNYIERIRTVQPSGPCRLLGWSFGGCLAHEMACQLEEAGEKVSLLAMLDAYPGDRLRGDEAVGEHDAIEALSHFAAPSGEAEKASDTATLLARLKEPGGMFSALDERGMDALLAVTANNIRLMRSHRPGRFSGALHFFAAAGTRAAYALSPDDWRQHVTGKIVSTEIDCDHESMCQAESLAIVAAALASELNDHLRPE
nr:alpha/beta fold hydrolase [Hyphomicrobiales bacterium]